MKFNKDCVRDILMYIEEHSIYKNNNLGEYQLHIVHFDELCNADSIKHENDIIYYALQKMEEYHLIKFNANQNRSNINRCFINYHISEITNNGHEFLDNVKNPECWNKIKTALANVGLEDCSLNICFDYIYNMVREQLNR